MLDLRDENARQARKGSVAAIIQLLNENLADSGIRTRAVRENGILQLLCEAESAEQLDQPSLVPRIKEILETIGPKNIRRVRINSRIMREQQSLWLEEIHRDPVNQLLWYEEITLARRNPLTNLVSDWREPKNKYSKQALLKASTAPFERDRRQLQRGIVGGIALTAVGLILAWFLYKFLVTPENKNPNDSLSVSSQNSNSSNISGNNQINEDDPFASAVRIAEQASLDGRKAQTRAQWLEIANRWQQASDLMAKVPASDRRYKTAQNRKKLYRQHSESALRQLEKRGS